MFGLVRRLRQSVPFAMSGINSFGRWSPRQVSCSVDHGRLCCKSRFQGMLDCLGFHLVVVVVYMSFRPVAIGMVVLIGNLKVIERGCRL